MRKSIEFSTDAKKVRRSARLAEKQPMRIATMDNGTMVEAFKFLNYCQLAKNCLVSKRFCDLIQTHRHKLALLYVDRIEVCSWPIADFPQQFSYATKIFDQKLSPEAYKEWVICSNYSKQIPLEDQVVGKQSAKYGGNFYEIIAYYKDSQSEARTTVLNARVELNNYNWPLFQHFVRLLSDPFIYINYLKLTPRIDISFMNLLAGALNLDSSRIRCGTLVLLSNGANIVDNVQKFIGWTKNHVLCKEFRFVHESDTNFDEEMLDFLMTGAHCTFAISINRSDISNVIVAFLQKFMGLKDSNEPQMVESIQCYGSGRVVEVLNRDYTKFIDKEEKRDQCVELINNDIGKKLQITVYIIVEHWVYFVLDIKNL